MEPKYYVVHLTVFYEGVTIKSFRLFTETTLNDWKETINNFDYPATLYLGGGERYDFASPASYFEHTQIEELSRTEYHNLKRTIGISYNWRDLEKTRSRLD